MKQLRVIIFLTFFLLLSVGQTQAAGFTLANITQSFGQKLQRLYLMLPGDKPAAAVLQQSAVALSQAGSWQATTTIEGAVVDENGEVITNGKVSVVMPVVVNDPNRDLFFKITELPELPFFRTDSLLNTWLRVAASPAEQTPAEVVGVSGQIIQKSQLSRARKETRNGVDIFVIEVAVPDEAIVESIPERSENMAAVLTAFEPVTVKLWIDQKTFRPAMVELPFTVDVAKMMAQQNTPTASIVTAWSKNQSLASVTGTLTTSFSNYDDPSNSQVPPDAVNLEEAIMNATVLGVSEEASPSVQPDSQSLLKTTPVELQELSKTEKEMLKRYGVEIENIIE